MNDYNFDYMNYLTNIPNNKMNYNKDKDKYNIKMLNQNSYNNEQILDPKEGFTKGNIFANLYDGYKNYMPQEPDAKNEREALLNQWRQYNFALIELNLHLDTHPNDTNAVKLYNNYNNILKQITNKYESMYGPLTTDSSYLNNNNWVWINSPWPWEDGKNV